ncbi:MAG: DUF2312 domain-containing protein [Rickettsia endosymbiont of Labidopullus appendiculatus]|nr:DUF2312 domain-containing protein [Rickettsia endosymbiont of Labidopullus appendiculatus]
MIEIIDSQDLVDTISKLEKLEEEKNELTDLIKDAYEEAKHKGYDIKIIKHVLKLKKKDKDDLAEEDSLIEIYRGALNI